MILLAILYILVVITAIALTRARKYSNQWEETFKNEAEKAEKIVSPQHPEKVCPICKTPTNLDFHYTPCPKCEYEGSTFNPLYDRTK